MVDRRRVPVIIIVVLTLASCTSGPATTPAASPEASPAEIASPEPSPPADDAAAADATEAVVAAASESIYDGLRQEYDAMSPEEQEAFRGLMQELREQGDPDVYALCDEVFRELDRVAAMPQDPSFDELDAMIERFEGWVERAQGTELEEPLASLVAGLREGDPSRGPSEDYDAGALMADVCTANGWFGDVFE